MPDSRPTTSQPSRYSYPLALLVLACLSAALIVATASLLAQDRAPIDANGTPALRLSVRP